MKILVYDIAAEDGGGLFVLKQFYQDVLQRHDNNKWLFIVSNNCIQSKENISVKRYENVKKSYFHRWLFETIELKKIVKKMKPDLVISLQNMPIKGIEAKQFTYLHQSLQYCPKRFSILRKNERNLAVRQKVICNIYKRYLPKSEHIFVQTNWIKEATQKWLNINDEKITVVPVCVNWEDIEEKDYQGKKSRVFFYPARAEMYKNHMVIINACRQLVEDGVKDFTILFTIKKGDNSYADEIIKLSKGLPIKFIGNIPYEQIWEYYRKTILLYPSYLETCGVPMLEARAIGGRIIASDMPFSHEDLDGYENVVYFSYNDSKELAEKMKNSLETPKYLVPEKKQDVCAESLAESMLEKM